MLQTNSTGVCSQCLSHVGPAPIHGAHRSGSRLLRRELSEAGPGLHAPPRSKPFRFRHSGSPQRRRLGGACVLCPPRSEQLSVWRAWSLRLIASPIPAAQLSGCTTGAPSQADGARPEPQEVLVSKEACCSLVVYVSQGLLWPTSGLPALAACHRRGMVCSWLILFLPLFCAQSWRCLMLELFTGYLSHSLVC